MRSRLRIQLAVTVLCALAADAAGPAAAFAYLDGGTGSLIFQWLIAGAVAGAFGVRMFWGRIAGLLRRKSAEQEDA